jgi:hypothetical protein
MFFVGDIKMNLLLIACLLPVLAVAWVLERYCGTHKDPSAPCEKR